MKQTLKILFVFTLVIYSLSGYSQVYKDDKGVQYTYFIQLSNGEGANLVRYGVMSVSGGYVNYNYLNLENWMWEITGRRPSRANPDSTDLLLKYQIPMLSIRDLWKLKYNIYPWAQRHEHNTQGWAVKKAAPSAKQMTFLKKYGIKKSISDPIYGNRLFNLLKDMSDPSWVNAYKEMY